MLLQVILLSFLASAQVENLRIFCESDDSKPNTFSLAANLAVDEGQQMVSTEAVLTMYDDKRNETTLVLESRGFYRSVEAKGGYIHAILVPLSKSNEVLSLDLKINIQDRWQSYIQLENTDKFVSDCRSL
tara:strand:+ start:2627 stop:3016 length:390 start_codon:yes stop_codon:yes gene_type:complete